jgi:hypothetical protein
MKPTGRCDFMRARVLPVLLSCRALSATGCSRGVQLDHPPTTDLIDGLALDDTSLDPFRVGDLVVGVLVQAFVEDQDLRISLTIYGDGDPENLIVRGLSIRGPRPRHVEVTDGTFKPSGDDATGGPVIMRCYGKELHCAT